MSDIDAGGDQPVSGTPAYDSFALAVQHAYEQARLHSPQAVPQVEERLRAKLRSRGITLTPDVLRALAFAIVTGRDL